MTIKDKIAIRYHFDVIRSGAKIGELISTSAAQIVCNDDASIKTALSGTFIVPESFNSLTDTVRPFMRINDSEDYPVGVFNVTTISEKYDKRRSVYDIEAYDNLYLIQRAKTETMIYYAAGTAYSTVFADIMTASGITAYNLDELTDTLATARSDWEIGTDYLSILNQLLSEVGYKNAYADANGVIQLRVYSEPSVDNISHTYTADEYSLIKPACKITTDLHSKYNIFIARCDNPEISAIMTATAENNSAACPYSTIFLPHIVAPIYNVDNIASQAALQIYINSIRDSSMLLTETIEFETAPNPTHFVGETVAIAHERISGIYHEVSWELSFSGAATMTHKAKRWLI